MECVDHEEEMDNWDDRIENFSILDRDKMLFILEENKNYLRTSLENSDKLDNKALILIGVTLTFINALGGISLKVYGFSELNYQKLHLLLPILFLIVAYIACCFRLIASVFPKNYNTIGNIPSKLLTNAFCSQDFHWMLYGEAISYEERIKENLEANEEKAERITSVLKWFIYGIGISLLIFVVMTFFSHDRDLQEEKEIINSSSKCVENLGG